MHHHFWGLFGICPCVFSVFYPPHSNPRRLKPPPPINPRVPVISEIRVSTSTWAPSILVMTLFVSELSQKNPSVKCVRSMRWLPNPQATFPRPFRSYSLTGERTWEANYPQPIPNPKPLFYFNARDEAPANFFPSRVRTRLELQYLSKRCPNPGLITLLCNRLRNATGLEQIPANATKGKEKADRRIKADSFCVP